MGSKKECNHMLKESRYEDEIKTDKNPADDGSFISLIFITVLT